MEIQKIKITEPERKLVSDFMGEEYPLEIDFNWLMPVVEKIVLLNPKTGKEWYYYNISHYHGHIWSNTAFGMNWETKRNSDKTITAVWLAVIDFIKFYNNNKATIKKI